MQFKKVKDLLFNSLRNALTYLTICKLTCDLKSYFIKKVNLYEDKIT